MREQELREVLYDITLADHAQRAAFSSDVVFHMDIDPNSLTGVLSPTGNVPSGSGMSMNEVKPTMRTGLVKAYLPNKMKTSVREGI